MSGADPLGRGRQTAHNGCYLPEYCRKWRSSAQSSPNPLFGKAGLDQSGSSWVGMGWRTPQRSICVILSGPRWAGTGQAGRDWGKSGLAEPRVIGLGYYLVAYVPSWPRKGLVGKNLPETGQYIDGVENADQEGLGLFPRTGKPDARKLYSASACACACTS